MTKGATLLLMGWLPTSATSKPATVRPPFSLSSCIYFCWRCSACEVALIDVFLPAATTGHGLPDDMQMCVFEVVPKLRYSTEKEFSRVKWRGTEVEGETKDELSGRQDQHNHLVGFLIELVYPNSSQGFLSTSLSNDAPLLLMLCVQGRESTRRSGTNCRKS